MRLVTFSSYKSNENDKIFDVPPPRQVPFHAQSSGHGEHSHHKQEPCNDINNRSMVVRRILRHPDGKQERALRSFEIFLNAKAE